MILRDGAVTERQEPERPSLHWGAMPRATVPACVGTLVLATIAWRFVPAEPRPAPPPRLLAPALVVDEKRCDYLEDEGTGRCLADIRASLVRRGGALQLRIVAAATGPRVDPVPGWRGVQGANRITAEEIRSIVEQGRMRVVTEGGADPAGASIEIGMRGRIPERRRAADGGIDVAGMTDVESPLELVATTPALGEGVRRTRLIVDEQPRLEIVTTIANGRARIREIRSLPRPEAERP
jgi:hypothetical protein